MKIIKEITRKPPVQNGTHVAASLDQNFKDTLFNLKIIISNRGFSVKLTLFIQQIQRFKQGNSLELNTFT